MTDNSTMNAAIRNAVNAKDINPRTTRAQFNAAIRNAAGYPVKKDDTDAEKHE